MCLFVAYIMSMIFVPDIELFTGSFGSLLVCFVFWIISDYIKLDVFEKLGQVSIGIYLFTGIVFYFLIEDYCRVTEAYRYMLRVGYVFGLSVVLTGAAYFICRLFAQNRVTSVLFLGKN